jgi:hypothetical protein
LTLEASISSGGFHLAVFWPTYSIAPFSKKHLEERNRPPNWDGRPRLNVARLQMHDSENRSFYRNIRPWVVAKSDFAIGFCRNIAGQQSRYIRTDISLSQASLMLLSTGLLRMLCFRFRKMPNGK